MVTSNLGRATTQDMSIGIPNFFVGWVEESSYWLESDVFFSIISSSHNSDVLIMRRFDIGTQITRLSP